METRVKHYRLTRKDEKNLEAVKKKHDCLSNSQTIRTCIRLAMEKEAQPLA
jgi:hypothetical protein